MVRFGESTRTIIVNFVDDREELEQIIEDQKFDETNISQSVPEETSRAEYAQRVQNAMA